MSPDQLLILLAFFLLAALYTSVGHAGASGYLAAMALVAIAPETMRPTALALNILVALFTTYRFWEAGYFSWRALWPFLLGSVPLAALGGSLRLTTGVYYLLAGAALALSAIVLAWRAWGGVAPENPDEAARIPLVPAIACGAVIGLLSGLTGTGGPAQGRRLRPVRRPDGRTDQGGPPLALPPDRGHRGGASREIRPRRFHLRHAQGPQTIPYVAAPAV